MPTRLHVSGLLGVLLGLTVFAAAPVRGQQGAGGPAGQPQTQPPAARPVAEPDSLEAINRDYERQVLELDRRRLGQVARLAAHQERAAAAATYEQLFRLAIAGNLFREAEPAAAEVIRQGSPSPTTAALAYLVKLIAESDRGDYKGSLATLRQALERRARPGAPRAALLSSEVVSLCDMYYQRLVQADQFEIARKAFRLAIEQAESPELKGFLSGRLRRLDLVGKPAPVIRGTDLDGKTFDLADAKGSVVLVEFWASWCLPSGDEVEWMKETARAYRPRGFRVVGINVDGLRSGGQPTARVLPEVRRFLLDHNVVWPTLLNGPGAADYAGAYGVTDIPANVLVGKDGTVTHIDLTGERLDAAIARELDR